MEAWEASPQEPTPWPTPGISLLSPPEQDHDSGWTPTPPRLCRQSSQPSRLHYGPRSGPGLRPVPELRPYLSAGAAFPPQTLRPDLLRTFLQAPVRPATVNLWYCDTPPGLCLESTWREREVRQEHFFFRGWQIPPLNVTLRYFCMTFLYPSGRERGLIWWG